MLFLFTGSFSQGVFAQAACNAMTTPGFSSCAGEVITYTSNVNMAATATWSISINTSGAFFVASGTSTVTAPVVPGPNTQLVNVGNTVGSFTITLTFAGQGNVGSCSASRLVFKVTATSSHTNVLCFGAATGTMTAVGSGGTAPYSYTIDGPTVNTTGASSGVFTGLTAGTYTITVRDATDNGGNPIGCTSTTTQTITQPVSALTATSSHTNVTCNTTNTGTVTAVGAGGTPPYSYVIAGPTVNTTGASSGIFTGLTAGVYTVTVTDANGCTTTTSQTVATDQCNANACSYTQGFWGNKNGLAKMQSSGILSTQMIIGSIAGNSILIPAGNASITKINDVMPGGSTPVALTTAGQCNILTACFDNNYLTRQGRINNVFLSQTITLSLNVRLGGGVLNNIPIQFGCLKTSAGSFAISASVAAYLTCKGTANVAGLLALANGLLGGTLTPGQNVGGCIVPSISDVNSAVDAINNAFDECQQFLGYGPCI